MRAPNPEPAEAEKKKHESPEKGARELDQVTRGPQRYAMFSAPGGRDFSEDVQMSNTTQEHKNTQFCLYCICGHVACLFSSSHTSPFCWFDCHSDKTANTALTLGWPSFCPCNLFTLNTYTVLQHVIVLGRPNKFLLTLAA